ncbi:Retrovirus-related Pol polyprotein from transposon TNT 1-94 [Vitis vinifera]|uniref:Retrovirus-related Pol polyprotein from transposon TNT 1-94 n=1 Tax=Vitis vinifera TaxID=29760 RepID=A0A438FXE6_VITVI|nr:Retrovirus-related Pol polyprotein from transposon TNT 1-94 [Vitis vinifera]
MIRRLVDLKYKDGNSVAKHLSNFQGLLNELSTMKLELDDEIHALLLLSSLLDSWETLVVSLSNSDPNGVITINMIKNNMFNEEDSTWVVDTTSSFHITARRDFFSSYTSGSFGWVRMGNEAKCEIVGMGDVELETSIGGYHSHLGEGKRKLTKDSLVLAKGKKNNTLYKTEARLVKGEVLARKKLLLIKVHTDVCTMQSNTLGGALYYVTFIDDHSRKVWAYALKSKDQVLDVFKDFHVMVERQTDKQLKSVIVDNGGEYRGHLSNTAEVMASGLRRRFLRPHSKMV